jgi:hypothetical protein
MTLSVHEWLVPEEQAYGLFNLSTRDTAETDDDYVLLGYFATHADAELAIIKLADRFPTAHRAFEVHPAYLNREAWSEGFGHD